MTEKVLAPVQRFIDEVLNQGKAELIREVWVNDMVWEGGSMGTIKGIENFTSNGVQSFSEMYLTVQDYTVKDNRVWVQFSNEGTQIGEFMGYPATNKHAKWNGVGIYTVENGKITRGWFSEDLLSMLKQLGHMK